MIWSKCFPLDALISRRYYVIIFVFDRSAKVAILTIF